MRGRDVERGLLRKLLVRRFGPLPAWAEAKLAGAELAQLEAWAEPVLGSIWIPDC